METDTVKQAGVALRIVHDDIVAGGKRINRGHDSLVAEIEKESVLLLFELGEHLLELLVETGVAGHHSGSHRIGQTILCGTLGISLAHLRMIGKPKVVVETPVEHFLAVEHHMRAEFTLEARIHIVTECLLEILAYRATGILMDPVKYVNHI